jgi:EAL and modified HD-GYP domain-containing signal transduction protein
LERGDSCKPGEIDEVTMKTAAPATPASPVAAGAGVVDSDTFVARIPILDPARRVMGYELVFRTGQALQSELSADFTAARVIGDAVLSVGLDVLSGGQRAFVPVSRRLVMEDLPSVLPPKQTVLLLGPDVVPDDDVKRACQEFRRAGYTIAIDAFDLDDRSRGLLGFAQYAKVRVDEKDAARRSLIVAGAGGAGVTWLAAGVETVDAFDATRREGFTLFQGFFFGRPTLQEARAVPAQQLGNLRLLQALNAPDISVTELEELIKRDASLAYRVLRTVNSAGFARRSTIESIRQALVLLGRDTIRRWASLWALSSVGSGAPSELVTMSTVRARACEVLATEAGGPEAGAQSFLVGMCSLLDAILECPLEAALKDLPLAEAARAALRGDDNLHRRLLDGVIAYEAGDWTTAIESAGRAGIDPLKLRRAYTDALRWAHELQNG